MLIYKRGGKDITNHFLCTICTYIEIQLVTWDATNQNCYFSENQGFGDATNRDMSLLAIEKGYKIPNTKKIKFKYKSEK